LRQGGYSCIRNGTRESDFPHRHFFPLRALIESDLPSRRDIKSVFAAVGFTPVVHQVVTQVTATNWPSFVEKSALRADSFLARLSDEVFDQGMAHSGPMATRTKTTRLPKRSIGSYLPDADEKPRASPISPSLTRRLPQVEHPSGISGFRYHLGEKFSSLTIL
jgi:hypothetical protein